MDHGTLACLAFLVCEEVVRDASTGKFTLSGLVDDAYMQRVPGLGPGLVAYAELTGASGRIDLRLQFARLLPGGNGTGAGEHVVPLRTWGYPPMVLRDSRNIAKIALQLADIEFPHFGDYLFLLVVGDQVLSARRFHVRHVRGAA